MKAFAVLILLFAPLALQAQEPRSLSLEEALALASPGSEDLAIARAGADRAAANVERVDAQRRPHLELMARGRERALGMFRRKRQVGAPPPIDH